MSRSQCYPFSSSPTVGPTIAASGISSSHGQLKSCLRRGNFSRGIGYGVGTPTAVGSATTHSLVPPSQVQLQQHYQQQQQQQQHHQASREEEESSTRSASSAPTSRSAVAISSARVGRSLASSSASTGGARSVASEPTETRSNVYHGGSSSNGNRSVDKRREEEEKEEDDDDDERHFMRISKLLVTRHMTGNYSNSTAIRNLIQEHMPQCEQRKSFHDSLRRNVAYLPMFPEPNEHPSLAVTRYVDKMFGPVLMREMHLGGSDGGGGGGLGLPMKSPVSYDTHSYPQQRQNTVAVIGRQPTQHHEPAFASGQPRQPVCTRYLLDEVMFPPPPTFSSTITANQALPNTTSPYQASSTNLFIPPPIPIMPIQHQVPSHGSHSSYNPAGLSVQTCAPTPTAHAAQTPMPTPTPTPLAYRTTTTTLASTAVTPKITNSKPPTMTDTQQQYGVKFSPSANGEAQSFSFTSSTNGKLPQQPQRYRLGVPCNSPPPQPLPFAPSSRMLGLTGINGYNNQGTNLTERPPSAITSRSLIVSSTDSSMEVYPEGDHTNNLGGDDISLIHSDSNVSLTLASAASRQKKKKQQQYQKFNMEGMLPPMTPRENILYHPHPHGSLEDQNGNTVPSSPSQCCDATGSCDLPQTNIQRQRRQPNYLQLYIKCERSEPFQNEDLDIVTWYRDGDNRVTADRTLVVQGTTSVMELIGGIVESFGLSSASPSSSLSTQQQQQQENGGIQSGLDDAGGDEGDARSQLACYNDVCFISDIKTTTCGETAETHLTPMPIPGLYYKYIDRRVDTKKKNESDHSNTTGKSSSSVLSTDPEGLRRTLVEQLLDKPIHNHRCSSSNNNDNNNEGSKGRAAVRNRLALVYCTPKRQACLSSRSTHQGVLPETIYHFQILLEGIVSEEDLPSSFQSQTPIRCVGATGGVLGGSIMDTRDEVDELNRTLWNETNGPTRDVIGLITPRANREENLEQIIDMLGVPLFDVLGNQTPKEFVVDRALYNIYSGKLSMEVARKTQHTMEVLEGTTEWLARRVEEFTKTLTDGATACEDQYLMTFENNDKFDEELFDMAISRFGISGSKTLFL
ncbi:hypothetical protein ACHAXR_012210 [Thalassiosira sp. AJA248-18]